MKDYIEILYDSFLDYQPSNYPYRIIRYVFNSEEGSLKFYKKQPEYRFDSFEIENYIKNKHQKASYKDISEIVSKFIGDERIINYKLNNKMKEIHFDREDKEYYYNRDEIKNILEKIDE